MTISTETQRFLYSQNITVRIDYVAEIIPNS